MHPSEWATSMTEETSPIPGPSAEPTSPIFSKSKEAAKRLFDIARGMPVDDIIFLIACAIHTQRKNQALLSIAQGQFEPKEEGDD